MQTDDRLSEAELVDIARLAAASQALVRDDEEARDVASAVAELRRIGEESAPRMARELRKLYERERVLQVEAEQLRAELVRTREDTEPRMASMLSANEHGDDWRDG